MTMSFMYSDLVETKTRKVTNSNHGENLEESIKSLIGSNKKRQRQRNHPSQSNNSSVSSPIVSSASESSTLVIMSETPTTPHSPPPNIQPPQRAVLPILTQPGQPSSRPISGTSTPISAAGYIFPNGPNNPFSSSPPTPQIDNSAPRSTQPTPRLSIASLINPPVPRDGDTVMTDTPAPSPAPAPDATPAPAPAPTPQLPPSSAPQTTPPAPSTHRPILLPSARTGAHRSPQVPRWTAINIPPVSTRSPPSQSPRFPRITMSGTLTFTSTDPASPTNPHGVRRGSAPSIPIMRHDHSPPGAQPARSAASASPTLSSALSTPAPACPTSSSNPSPRASVPRPRKPPTPALPLLNRYFHSISSDSPPSSPSIPPATATTATPGIPHPSGTARAIVLDATVDPYSLAPLLPAALDLTERLSFDIRAPRLQEEAIMRVREKYSDWTGERAREEVRSLCKRFNRRNAPRRKREKKKPGEKKATGENKVGRTVRD
ncbi:hypothetical protein FPQ18DRAFT_309962 [Pyronema domesticum]|nr:hypothetical protein FPQ18DRAFT_309962 [Pyronema domesticum]